MPKWKSPKLQSRKSSKAAMPQNPEPTMSRNNPWIFLFVVLIVCWSFYEMYPPRSRSLVQGFETRAVNRDTNFTGIVQRLQPLVQAGTNSEFGNLQEAIGTNGIQTYFPFFNSKNELYPNTFILNQLQRDALGKIKLGLDLQGGTSFLVSMDTNRLVYVETVTNSQGVAETVTNMARTEGALSQAVEVLRKRVDAFGVAEPIIQPAGGNRILIQLPGLSHEAKESAKKQIQKAAYLEFRMVKEDSDEIIKNNEPIPPGYVLLKRVEPQPNGPPTIEQIIVKKKPEKGLAGDIIENSMAVRGNLGEPQIDFRLNSEGAKRFGEVTKNNIGQRLAIILDGDLYSAPVIQSAIETGSGQITGHLTSEQAQELANVLQNPLRAPLVPVSSYDVDPTLGRDSIRSGIHASIAGVVLVSAFMLCYYLLAGVVANVALVTNIIILLGVMCSVGTTLTLRGIAGVVLTIGMAVEANVLIFERIREESGKGKSLRGALAAGYERAFRTIFDSHVTTLISSTILICFGTGPIKGFGVTLTIGVAASLFTALVVTRLIFGFLLVKGWLKSLPMLHIIRVTKLDFMRFSKFAFVGSLVLIVAGLGYGVFDRGRNMLGIDFAGGDNLVLRFAQKVEPDKLREAIAGLGVPEAQIQFQRDMARGSETLRITSPFGTGDHLSAELGKLFPAAKFEQLILEKVGPTIGAEIMRTAIIASLLSMLGRSEERR